LELFFFHPEVNSPSLRSGLKRRAFLGTFVILLFFCRGRFFDGPSPFCAPPLFSFSESWGSDNSRSLSGHHCLALLSGERFLGCVCMSTSFGLIDSGRFLSSFLVNRASFCSTWLSFLRHGLFVLLTPLLSARMEIFWFLIFSLPVV